VLVENLFSTERPECALGLPATITANGETTDEIVVGGVQSNKGCLTYEWFGVLPSAFTLHLNSDGSASIEGAMGAGRNTGGCVYEGDKLTGGFEGLQGEALRVGLSELFTLIEEETPGEECSETERVFMSLEPSQRLRVELVQ